MPETKLLLCPLCGGKAELRHIGYGSYYASYVYCTSCGMSTRRITMSIEYDAVERG